MRPFTLIFIFFALFSASALFAQTTSGSDMSIRWYGDSATFVVMRDGKFGIVREDKEIIPVKYKIENFMWAVNWDGDCYFNDGAHFALGAEGKWGVMDNHGEVVVPFEYDYITMEREYGTGKLEYAGVEKNGKCAIMGANGKLLTGFEFDAFYGYYRDPGLLYSGNTLAVKKDGKLYFFEPGTKKLLNEAPKLEFTPEVAIVGYKFKQGVISRTGKIILRVEYDFVRSATIYHYADPAQPLAVYQNDSCGLWWPGKNFIIPMAYRSIQLDYSGETPYVVAMRGEKYALFSGEGKQLTEFLYDAISISSSGITATQAGKQYTLSPDGKAAPKQE